MDALAEDVMSRKNCPKETVLWTPDDKIMAMNNEKIVHPLKDLQLSHKKTFLNHGLTMLDQNDDVSDKK